jgi:hypothetical protein
MATTLLLDRANYDLCLTVAGDIAVASEPYSLAQDVASECRVVQGEAWYDTRLGVPYFSQVLGRAVPVQLLKEHLATAAKRVPGVENVTVYLTSITSRAISGQIQFNGGTVSL